MPTIKQKAALYDHLMQEIEAREPSISLVCEHVYNDYNRLHLPTSLESQFLWAFDQLIDEHKQRKLATRDAAPRKNRFASWRRP